MPTVNAVIHIAAAVACLVVLYWLMIYHRRSLRLQERFRMAMGAPHSKRVRIASLDAFLEEFAQDVGCEWQSTIDPIDQLSKIHEGRFIEVMRLAQLNKMELSSGAAESKKLTLWVAAKSGLNKDELESVSQSLGGKLVVEIHESIQ